MNNSCIFKVPFVNEKIVYGVQAFNIVIVIITASLAAKYFGLNQIGTFLFTFVIGYVLFKFFCINTVFTIIQKDVDGNDRM